MMVYNLVPDSNLDLDVIKNAWKAKLASIVFHANKTSSLFIPVVKVCQICHPCRSLVLRAFESIYIG
jgi:hypothetical protein